MTGWRRMVDLSLPNFYGSVGAVIVVAVALKAFSIAQGGYAIALSHLGPWWTGAGIGGLIFLAASIVVVMRRRALTSSDRTQSGLDPSTLRRLLGSIQDTIPIENEDDGRLGARILFFLNEWRIRAGSQTVGFLNIAEKIGMSSEIERVGRIIFRLVGNDLVRVSPGSDAARISPIGQSVLRDPVLFATRVDADFLEALLP